MERQKERGKWYNHVLIKGKIYFTETEGKNSKRTCYLFLEHSIFSRIPCFIFSFSDFAFLNFICMRSCLYACIFPSVYLVPMTIKKEDGEIHPVMVVIHNEDIIG